VACGEYDWTQGNAIEVLCRLAADGVESEAILEEMRTLLPVARYEAVAYATGPLLNHARSEPKVARIVDALLKIPAFAAVHAEMTQEGSRRDSSVPHELVFRGSFRKVLLLLAISIAFVAIGLWMTSERPVLGWLCAGFFALGIPASLFMMRHNSTYLRLTDKGIEIVKSWRCHARPNTSGRTSMVLMSYASGGRR
jgi:hypothetical protein